MVLAPAQMMPSFIVPGLAAAGAAAVAVPILIHILSRRPRRPEPWAAMKFLLAAYQRHRMRTRMEQWLLLATRCLLVLLLGLALAGPVLSAVGALGAWGGSQRTLVIVLDNSLTTQANGPGGQRRFEGLKQQAVSLLEGLRSTDRAALVTVARPAEAVVSPAAADPMSVRRQVELVEPSAGAAELGEALGLAMNALAETEAAAEDAYVVLLSDFSEGGVQLGEPLPSEVTALGQRATLLMSEPEETATNVGLASLKPDRRLVVAEGMEGDAQLTWTVGVQRHADEAGLGEQSTTVRLELPDASPIRRQVDWETGQREAELRIDTPLERGMEGLISAQAIVEPAAGGEGGDGNALTPDDARWALVQARDELNVLVLGRRQEQEATFGPQRWLRTALAPVGDELGWPIEVSEQDAAAFGDDGEDLRGVDAAYIIRPDLLSDGAWDALLQWIEQGGLAWFAPPAEGAATLWPQRLSDGLGLGWSVAADPVEHDEPLRLSTEVGSATELERLQADLADLLRPIEVHRRLDVDPDSLAGGSEQLLSGSGGEPVLIAASPETGSGRVLLLTSALDGDWTNLPTKPLFVPLIHEVLRAGIDRLQPEDAFEAGDQPVLGSGWSAGDRLDGPDDTNLLLIDSTSDEADDAEADEDDAASAQVGVMPIRPLTQPGVYEGETDAVVVNVAADAADTRAVDPGALEAWLGEVGQWRELEQTEGMATLGGEADRADLSWPLLWAVAFLALAEMALARHVSHASQTRRSVDITSVRNTGQAA